MRTTPEFFANGILVHNCAWKYAQQAWENLRLAMRGGRNPKTLVTTTPTPTLLTKRLVTGHYPGTIVRKFSTYRNAVNLPESFITEIMETMEGTRLGRQEVHAEILEDVEGAMLTFQHMDDAQVSKVPPLRRIVVAVDPSGSAKGDACGIVVAGVDFSTPPIIYVLADRTIQASPDTWSQTVVEAFREFRADRIIGEENFGGQMLMTILRSIDALLPYTATHASRGKQIRAEPVAAMYERGLVKHMGRMAQLETDWTEWVPGTSRFSPNALDALVMAAQDLVLNSLYGHTGFHDPSDDYVPTEDLFALPHVSELT